MERAFSGAVATVRCHEDNVLVRARLNEPGAGRVLAVNGGGSLRCALLGDMLARLALENGWVGVVVNGCIRDSAAFDELSLGMKAIGTNPQRSRKDGHGEARCR